MYVLKERSQVQRLVKVVGEQFQMQDLLFHTPRGRLQKGAENRTEHVLAERPVGPRALCHHLRINATVILPNFSLILQPRKQPGEQSAAKRQRKELDPTRYRFVTHLIFSSACICRRPSRVRSHSEWAGRRKKPRSLQFGLCNLR